MRVCLALGKCFAPKSVASSWGGRIAGLQVFRKISTKLKGSPAVLQNRSRKLVPNPNPCISHMGVRVP